MPNKKLLAASSIAVLLFVSCATTRQVNTSRVTYRSDAFSRSELLQSSIGILPVVGAEDLDSIRNMAVDSLCVALKRWHPSQDTQGPALLATRINEAGCASEYSEMMRTFVRLSSVRQDLLKRISTATGCRYILFSRIAPTYFLHLPTRKVMSQGSFTVKKTIQLEIHVQLWDGHIGDTVWEGVGGSAAIQNSEEAMPAMLVSKAADGLARIFGHSQDEVPRPEDPSALSF